jgi:hypothetical protein
MSSAQKRDHPTSGEDGSSPKRHHASQDGHPGSSSQSGVRNLPESKRGDTYHLPMLIQSQSQVTSFQKAVQRIRRSPSLEMRDFESLAHVLAGFAASGYADLDPTALDNAVDIFRKGFAGEALEADEKQLYTDAENALMKNDVDLLLRNRVYFPAFHLD